MVDPLIGLLQGAFRMATPLLFAALGEVIVERSGVINLGMEGMMEFGAFAGFWAVFMTGNYGLGLLAGIACGAILGLLMAFLCVSMRVNQVVAGLAMVTLGVGLAFFFYREIFGTLAGRPMVTTMPPSPIPILSEIPALGDILFKQSFLVYLALLIVPVLWIIVFRTTAGLKIRSIGENPKASDSLGINVSRARYLCVVFGGMMCGLAGAFLTTAYSNMFLSGIVSGRGWIAFVAVIFGRYNPLWVMVSCLIFGGADSLGLTIAAAGVNIPYQFALMVPYLVTLVAIIAARKIRSPGSLGTPYQREG